MTSAFSSLLVWTDILYLQQGPGTKEASGGARSWRIRTSGLPQRPSTSFNTLAVHIVPTCQSHFPPRSPRRIAARSRCFGFVRLKALRQ